MMSLKRAALLNTVSRYFAIIWGIIITAFLSRILTPEDYGIVAVTVVFTTLFNLFANMGIGTGVIQNKELTEENLGDIFSITIYISVVLSGLFAAFSVPMSYFYSNSVYVPIGILLAVSLFFSSMNVVPNALLMKDQDFLNVAIRTICISVLAGCIAVILAMLGFKYYAIVIQSVVMNFATFVWNYRSVRKRYLLKVQMKPDGTGIKKILSFSSYQFFFNIINYFARNLDNLLVSKVIGESALGYYNKAYTLTLYPVQNMTNVISPVLHPILSVYENDKEYIYEKYMKVFKLLSLLGLFFSIYCFFAGDELILIMFGDQWVPSIVCFKALSVSIWFQMTSTSCGSIYMSLGNTKLMFKSALVFVPIQIACIIVGVISLDIVFLSWLISISFIAKFLIEYFNLIQRGLNRNFMKFILSLYPELIMGIVLCVAMMVANLIRIENLVLSAAYKLSVCSAIFFILLIVMNQWQHLMVVIPKKGPFKRFDNKLKKNDSDLNKDS